MKTFDEYIQGRIYEAWINKNPDTVYDNFADLYSDCKSISISSQIGAVISWGVGKQRAKDYAHYIVAYIAEQENKKQDALLRGQIDRHSHLTDEDAEKIISQLSRLIYMVDSAELIDFINSLKGE